MSHLPPDVSPPPNYVDAFRPASDVEFIKLYGMLHYMIDSLTILTEISKQTEKVRTKCNKMSVFVQINNMDASKEVCQICRLWSLLVECKHFMMKERYLRQEYNKSQQLVIKLQSTVKTITAESSDHLWQHWWSDIEIILRAIFDETNEKPLTANESIVYKVIADYLK